MEQLTKPFSHAVCQTLEFAGYGPCVPTSDYSIKVQCLDKIFELFFRASDGSLQGHPRLLDYQNPIDPLVHAVLSVIKVVYMDYGKMPPPQSSNTVKFSQKIEITVRYLWMHDIKQNTKLVLHELFVEGYPVWHLTDSIPYDCVEDETFWERNIKLLDDFRKNGTLGGLDTKEVQKAIAFCVEEK